MRRLVLSARRRTVDHLADYAMHVLLFAVLGEEAIAIVLAWKWPDQTPIFMRVIEVISNPRLVLRLVPRHWHRYFQSYQLVSAGSTSDFFVIAFSALSIAASI
jgi:hypothetical protein